MRTTEPSKSGPASRIGASQPQWMSRLSDWARRHPFLAIVLVSLAAVTINCYPIIICGKSFVSPTGVPMLYEGWPTLPGMKNTPPVRDHGSDSGAMLVWGVPAGFVESRSLLEHGELPLWNRYGHAGDTLIGQAVSMLGDPLQLIVIAGRGSAVAWDIKFVVAKFLFCVGFGLLILRLLGSPGLSLIFAALAAYCGAFFYIYCHMAFFVFTYAPWILLSALAFFDLQSRNWLNWGFVWLLANFACFNAGHVELAVVLIAGLNLSALAQGLIASGGTLLASAKIFARLAVGTALFLALTAPVWVSFAVALQGAFSLHSEVKVVQFPRASLLGIFDDVFFRLPLKDDTYAAPAPGSSLLVAVGAIFSWLRGRQFRKEPFFWINTAAIIIWTGCVFRWMPESVLSMVPLLNRVGHTHTDFSYLLVLHLTFQSAFGFKALANNESFERKRAALILTALIIAVIVTWYCISLWHRFAPWDYFTFAAIGALGAPWLFGYWKNKSLVPPLAWFFIIFLGFMANIRFGLYTFDYDNLFMVPGPRLALNGPSPAIDKVKADHSAPFRMVGMGWSFFGDYAAVYGLEDIRSCAPLSNGELVNLIQTFPGMKPWRDWEVQVADPAAAQGLLNLLNVKYVFASPKADAGKFPGFQPVAKSDFTVVANPEAWPRAFFSEKVIALSSSEEFIHHLIENSKEPFVALTPEDINAHTELIPFSATNTPAIVPATNYQLLPNSTAFDIHAASAGVVCLTEGQAKDFVATANGERKTVLTVNRAFKGVYLEKPGDYHIEFTYRPRYWRVSCTFFWLALAAVAAVAGGNLLKLRLGRKAGQMAGGGTK